MCLNTLMSNKNKHIELLIICCLIIFTLPFIIQLQVTQKNTTIYKMGKVDTIEIKSIVRGKLFLKMKVAIIIIK